MLKFIIRAGILAGVVFALILLSGTFFRDKRKLQSFKSEEFSSRQDPVDIAIFGSSHAYSAYDPKLLEHELGARVFNFGAPVQNLRITRVLAEEVLEKGTVRLGIVDIFRSSLEEPPLSEREAAFQYESLDYMDLSADKVRVHNMLYGEKSVLNILPAIREHAVWDERLFQPEYKLSREVDYNKGYQTDLYFNRNDWNSAVRNKEENLNPQIYKSIKLSGEQKLAIKEILELFREYQVPLLFVSAPVHKRYVDNVYYTYQHLIRTYLKKLGATLIDYNELWDLLELHLYDFKDFAHVNSSGALKVSRHLAGYIRQTYPDLGKAGSKSAAADPTNRFFQMDTGFKAALAHIPATDPEVARETGVREIAVFPDGYGRLEILLTGQSIRELNLRVAYEMPEYQARNLPRSVANRITKNKYVQKGYLRNLKKEGQYGGSLYRGKEFKVVKVDCPFSEITNLKVFIGKDRPAHQVLRLVTDPVHVAH